jgi:hypothetical protein
VPAIARARRPEKPPERAKTAVDRRPSAGWFIIPGLLAKAEYVNQQYFGYPPGKHQERRKVPRRDCSDSVAASQRDRRANDNGHTLVRYDLTAVPSFRVPGALLSRLLKRDGAAMIMQLPRKIGRSICSADGRS